MWYKWHGRRPSPWLFCHNYEGLKRSKRQYLTPIVMIKNAVDVFMFLTILFIIYYIDKNHCGQGSVTRRHYSIAGLSCSMHLNPSLISDKPFDDQKASTLTPRNSFPNSVYLSWIWSVIMNYILCHNQTTSFVELMSFCYPNWCPGTFHQHQVHYLIDSCHALRTAGTPCMVTTRAGHRITSFCHISIWLLLLTYWWVSARET